MTGRERALQDARAEWRQHALGGGSADQVRIRRPHIPCIVLALVAACAAPRWMPGARASGAAADRPDGLPRGWEAVPAGANDTTVFVHRDTGVMTRQRPAGGTGGGQCTVRAVATAASAEYFLALMNLVGSLHHYEPDTPILVYDLGLSQRQLHVVRAYVDGVIVVPFMFDEFPPHVRDLGNYAWKACVVLDAVSRFGSVLFLDAGMELRYFLPDLRARLAAQGAWFVAAVHDMPLHTRVHPGQYRALGLDGGVAFSASGAPHPSLAVGMMGWCSASALWHELFTPWLRCSLQLECILPRGANASNHRWEQSALSLLFFSRDAQLQASTRAAGTTAAGADLPAQRLPLEQSQMYWVSKSVKDSTAALPGCSPRPRLSRSAAVCTVQRSGAPCR